MVDSKKTRNELSREEKIRLLYYEILNDSLEQFLINEALLVSYNEFIKNKIPYPFVDKKELKPKAAIPNMEYDLHKSFLVLFLEDGLYTYHKKYIHILDYNKVNKANLSNLININLQESFHINKKYLEDPEFFNFLKELLTIDYALLIQRDLNIKKTDRYNISHFHVKIDWPVSEAAEMLAKNLRYIAQDIFEKGEEYAETLQKKFFEYYGLPMLAGGRRTAAIVASEYFKKISVMATIYVCSQETRSLIQIAGDKLIKYILVPISNSTMNELAEKNNMTITNFKDAYVIAEEKKEGICIFKTSYALTEHSTPPISGKLRTLKTDANWRTVDKQYILPKPNNFTASPIEYNIIYN